MMNKKFSIIQQMKEQLQDHAIDVKSETIFFVTTCEGTSRATVWRTQGSNFAKAWFKVERYINKFLVLPIWLKVEIVTSRKKKSLDQAIKEIKLTKRNNYFPYGIEFGNKYSLLSQEIVGNAILVPDPEHIIGKNSARLQVHKTNLENYLKKKYQQPILQLSAILQEDWYFFSTFSVFVEGGKVYPLESDFFGKDVRKITDDNQLIAAEEVIEYGTAYLSRQIREDGSFIYGYYPAYDKIIPGYNSVRHFSSLYALIEAYEYSKDETLLMKIDKGLFWGIEQLSLEKNGQLFIMEKTAAGIELKLGAQAMVILALSKYEAVTNDPHYHQLLLNYLSGLKAFIDDNGSTVHVLDEQLRVKERFRIIYYDGEALFSIMRAYPLTDDPRWLRLGEKLMDRFILNRYEKFHDHWLSYSVNELTTYLPKREYFEFGIKNAIGNLDFIHERDTAYPTMLELLVAAAKMYKRLSDSPYKTELLKEEEHQKLLAVTRKRLIHELRTGTMWPELAMYYARPAKIRGGFYARHARCRMRIDDAEHFLSGIINYKQFMDIPLA